MNKIIKSFGFALNGIRSVIQSETNMKIHLTISFLVVVFGFVFSISVLEWLACLLCMALVIGVEMINTAIENVVDLASPEEHPLAAKAKDIAAGAVLVCAFFSVVVGIVVFLPKLWS
jgi:diacylglycerol kinase